MTDTLERTARPEKPRRRRSRWRSMAFIALLVSVGFVATGVLPVKQYLDRGKDVTVAQQRLDELVDHNRRLQDNADALLTDQEIERVAREQYGFVREGEIGYTVITPDGSGVADAEPVEPVDTTTERRGFLQRIWDFLSGRDVASDG